MKVFLIIASFLITSCNFNPEDFKKFASQFADEFGQYTVEQLYIDCVQKYQDQYSEEKKEAKHYGQRANKVRNKDHGQTASYTFLQARHTAQAANRAKAVVECYQEILKIDPNDPAAKIDVENWKVIAERKLRSELQTIWLFRPGCLIV